MLLNSEKCQIFSDPVNVATNRKNIVWFEDALFLFISNEGYTLEFFVQVDEDSAVKFFALSATQLAFTTALSAIVAAPVQAAPNNPPSFEPGLVPVASPCDGEIRLSDWAVNVTDGDGETSGLKFRMMEVSNAEIFVQYPFVSWPSLTLSYRLKPGTPAGVTSHLTAILRDTSGTGQGGSDTSDPVSWSITTAGCVDVDLDGVDDSIDSEILFVDTDGDGLHDNVDLDDDNDGLSDLQEGNGLLDTDGDGIPDSLDTDSDNDGIGDLDESGDSDGDGIPDSQEPGGTDVTTDTDGDGVLDGEDTDDDNDGLTDDQEGNGQIDSDNDGIPDSLDPDSDNDGLPDAEENDDSNGDGVPDSQQPDITDTDGDGIADNIDTDDDNDGLTDDQEGNGQIDTDGDGIPDSRDPDSNNDGIGDNESPQVDPQSGVAAGFVETGLKGGGCSLSRSGTFDPSMLLMAVVAVAGLFRRKSQKFRTN